MEKGWDTQNQKTVNLLNIPNLKIETDKHQNAMKIVRGLGNAPGLTICKHYVIFSEASVILSTEGGVSPWIETP